MCICDLNVNEKKLITDGCWNSLYIERNKYDYFIVASGDGNAYMKINYCPKCGRRLEDEE